VHKRYEGCLGLCIVGCVSYIVDCSMLVVLVNGSVGVDCVSQD
jgi:hypothetical protein